MGASSLSFLRYIASHGGAPLVRAILFLIVVSATEGLSVVLILPVISLAAPGRTALSLHLPSAVSRSLDLPGQVQVDLRLALGCFILLIAVRALAVRAKDIEITRVLYRIINRLRIELFRAIGASRWSFFSQQKIPDLNHALTADVDRIQVALLQCLLLGQALFSIGVYVLVSIFISPLMTVFAAGVGVLMLALLHPLRRRAHRQGAFFSTSRQEQFATVHAFLSGMKVVKAANAERPYVDRLASGLDELAAQTVRYTQLSTIGDLVFQLLTAVAVSAFVGIALLVVRMSRAEILLSLFIFLRIGPRIMGLQQQAQDLILNVSSFTAIQALSARLAKEDEGTQYTGPRLKLEQALEVRRVSFRYPVADQPALDEVSAIIPARRITAIISASGGGKSTLADILLGLLEPASGRLLVDGLPVEADARRAWRNEVAYVPQDTFLLDDTVTANLRLTAPAASEAELWTALRAARMDQVVERLPGRLNAMLGERGSRLSGGERQRLALARALLRRPQLLILDEATSALDWENQSAIAQVIRALRGHCTVITIAHRPSMIDFADFVITLEEGRVRESGAYEALRSNPASYLARLLAGETGRNGEPVS